MEEYACFSSVFSIQCQQENQIIVFKEARYGSNDTAIAQHCSTPYQKKCDVDVHFTLNRQCGGKNTCSLVVNVPLFGDPCGYKEFLKVKYMCVSGECYVYHFCTFIRLRFSTFFFFCHIKIEGSCKFLGTSTKCLA